MSYSGKEIIFGILLLAIAVGLTRYCTPTKIRYETSDQVEVIDSLTTVTIAQRAMNEQLQDSLEQTTEAFQEYINNHEDELAVYNRVVGELNLTIDSLETIASLSIWDLTHTDSSSTHTFRDTTLHQSSTFGDGLIKATATAGIRSDSLFLDPPQIRQLRPVRIDQGVFITEDNSQVRTITTSPDFDSLEVVTLTPLEPGGKRFPWTEIVAGASFLLGVLL